jgi:transposase-like protein
MTPEAQNTDVAAPSQADFQALLREKLRQAVRLTLISVLQAEVEAVTGAERYERTPTRRDHRNGEYERGLVTSLGAVRLRVPRTRGGFETNVFARYQRRQAELDVAIGEMFVKGVSTAGVGVIVEQLTGEKPSPSTVSRVHQTLAAEFKEWQTRPLAGQYRYVFADGTYFTVIYGAEGHKMPVLAVIGITPDGRREVLLFTIGERENQTAWEDVLEQLKQRGVQQVELWITDGNQAMLNAVTTKFPNAQRQRCIKHKMENVLSYVPQKQRAQVEPELKAIFYQPDRGHAEQHLAAFSEKFARHYPTAVACLQRDVSACLTFYAFPEAHWKTLRTTNVIERLFQEVKKRSKKMNAAFRNEDSCLLLFYAVIRSLEFRRLPVAAK